MTSQGGVILSEAKDLPFLGFGVGLRTKHYGYILKNEPPIDWFEVISENYMVPGGRPLFVLDQIKERYPVVMHGVSLSIGSTDPLNKVYLKNLKSLAERVQPQWISDHLCWTGTGGHNAHDLLPLPYNEEALDHVVRRVKMVQDFLERPLLLENVSSYLQFTHSTMTEWEFLSSVAREADCFILLDINNIYVSAVNHSFDPQEYLHAVPVDRVKQYHLAGHSDKGTHLLDTHDHPIKPEVWGLYKQAIRRFGPVSTLVEWDDHIPPFPKLFEVAKKAKKMYLTFNEAPARTISQDDTATPLEIHQSA
ncbi:MAG: DUF692 domain-containing protein [Deltaproteobacteria bacterium]|nr:DUF692 domain-containing protein [Deltaproteobacteria bacterium]